ncbi:MAG: tetratricopeptide repeat protein [Prevotella sp.]|nr:tetratricopeptide repeat protein [Prevotella sp.]
MTDETAYFKSEEFMEILQQYEDSVKSGHPIYMDADDLASIADYYHYHGRVEEADNVIDQALQYSPEAVAPLLYKAREALSENNFDKAREYAERIHPSDEVEYQYLKGEILICEGKVDEADDLFRQHYREVPPDELMDYVYDVANLFSDYDLHDKAFQWMARSRGDDSDDFKELMAHTLFGLGKYKDSERIFTELIDHDPFSKKYWVALASAQFMSEDYGASVTSSEYAIAIDPSDPESILSKANGLLRLENYEEALNYFERYNDLIDDDEFGYLHQGTCLISLGRMDEAVERLRKAAEVASPDSQYLPDIYQELAFVYNELKMPETAIYYINKTKYLDCNHNDMEVIRGHILLANNRLDEAGEVFERALKNSGNAPKTMLRIIVSLYDNQRLNDTYRLFKKYFKYVDDEWNEGYSYMALCCKDLHKVEEFLTYLELATEKNPKEAQFVLGHLFPKGMPATDYVDYVRNKINKE